MTFDVSASKQALAFGDSEGCVHLWADTPDVTFNTYSRETDFALPCIVDTLPHLDWNQDLVPLSLIPVPLTTDTLLSDWPAANAAPAPRRAPPVDPEILRTMKKVGFIGYAPNPRTKLRNQVPRGGLGGPVLREAGASPGCRAWRQQLLSRAGLESPLGPESFLCG